MSERKNDGTVVELPPSDYWTPEQAIAAAARAGYQDLLIIGRDAIGEITFHSSRLDPGEILLLLKEVELTTVGR